MGLCCKRLKSAALAALLALLPLLLSACSSNYATASKTSFKFYTFVTLTLYGTDDVSIIDECFELCDRYELIFSRTSSHSELYALNEAVSATGRGQAGDELASLIASGLQYSALSGGALDITIAPVSSLWDFSAENPAPPAEAKISAALPCVEYGAASVQGGAVTAAPGMSFDLGGISKGYIADRLKEFLLSRGVNSAIINIGGNVLCVGKKPDGKPFKIGIRKPFGGAEELTAELEVDDLSIVTSGTYERYFDYQGKRYHHLLDPSTGWPCENGLTSVTIVSRTSLEGDALSTACFVLGLEKGMALVNSLDGVYAMFIDDFGNKHYSDGFYEFTGAKAKP